MEIIMILTKAQQSVVDCINDDNRLIIVNTPPGSGKTAICSQIIQEVADSSRYLAVTFNKKASMELQTRSNAPKHKYSTNGICYCSTIHSYCYNILFYNGIIRKVHNDEIWACLNELLKNVEEKDESAYKKDWEDGFEDSLDLTSAKKEFLHIYNLAIVYGFDPIRFFSECAITLQHCSMISNVVKLFTKFLIEKKRNNWITFADLLKMTRDYLRKTVDIFDFIVVDEAQDIDFLQMDIIKNLIQHCKKVFLVGDCDQSIYKWRGATNKPLINWNGHRIILDESFRIKKQVADVVKRLIKWNKDRIDMDWKPQEGESEITFNGVYKELSVKPTEFITEKLKEVSSLTILSRTNYYIEALAKDIINSGFPIKIKLSGEYSYGFNNDSAKSILQWIEYLENPDIVNNTEDRDGYFQSLGMGIYGVGNKRWQEAYNKYNGFNASKLALQELTQKRGIAMESLKSRPPSSKIEIVSRLITGRDNSFISQNLKKIKDNFPNFIQEIKSPRITASTIHRFKGKEDNHIIIIGVNDKNIPHKRSPDLEEERRLLYVAMTRTKNSVDLFFNYNAPSPFLAEM
jgi:DNA helicase-2/ATP-dependent DNA helicase PcrA